jgi:tryptophan-rich sensory protein
MHTLKFNYSKRLKKLLQKIRLNYFLIPLLVVITGSAASYFAQTGRVWYKTINLPIWIWTPSNTLMVAAWAVIFILSSVAVLIVWNRYSAQKNFRLIMTLFILNAVINIGWYILFFGHQQLGLAFFQAVLLVSNVALLIVLIWKFCPLAATCLLPYSLWVIFSTIFTFNVWLMN